MSGFSFTSPEALTALATDFMIRNGKPLAGLLTASWRTTSRSVSSVSSISSTLSCLNPRYVGRAPRLTAPGALDGRAAKLAPLDGVPGQLIPDGSDQPIIEP